MNRSDPKSSKKRGIARRATRFVGFPNLNHLYYFHVVALEGSLKQGCAILGVTQPTISAQIKSLEEFVGVRLFRREVGGMRLSAAGHRMFEHTSVMFRATEMMVRGFAQDSIRGAPAMEMAVASSVSDALPTRHFLTLMEPEEVFMRLRHGDHLPLLSDLLAGEIDVLLTDIGPDGHEDPRLTAQIVHQPRLIAVCSFGDKVSDVFPVCLDEADLFHYSVGCKYRWEIDRYLHQESIEPNVIAESDSAQLMLNAAEQGLCIAIVPESLAQESIAMQRVRKLGDMDGIHTDIFALYLLEARPAILAAIGMLRAETGVAQAPEAAGKGRGGRRRQVRSTEGFTLHTTLPPDDEG